VILGPARGFSSQYRQLAGPILAEPLNALIRALATQRNGNASIFDGAR
jgi:hypothetical protein